MKKRIISGILMLGLLLSLFSMGALAGNDAAATRTAAANAALTDYYWYQNIQSQIFFDFREDGSFCTYDTEGNWKPSETLRLTANDLTQVGSWYGTYTFDGKTVTLNFAGGGTRVMDLYNRQTDPVPSEDAAYDIAGYQGNVYFYETGWAAPEEWEDDNAMYLVRLGKKTSAADRFTDVPAGSWYLEPVEWAVEQGITDGTSETTFSPLRDCTRAQVVTFLWRAAGSPKPTTTTNPFTDVKESSPYYQAILWAAENGITTGTSATSFSPNGYCNRAQTVTFLWRAAGSPKPTTTTNPFTDVAKSSPYYQAILWAAENGITTGTSGTSFSPTGRCSRAQVVTFLYRIHKT